MKTNPNDQITPIVAVGFDKYAIRQEETYFGLTKLEYFSALTMQGLLANSPINGIIPSQIAEKSVTLAKELVKALNRHNDEQKTTS